MRNKITCLWLSLLCIVGAFSSCSSTPSASKLVPDDASVVLYFDVKEFISQADYDGSDELTSMFEKALKDGEVGASTREKVMDIVENPKRAGIDLSEPMLFFVSPSFVNQVAFVGAVSDDDDFEEFLNALSKEDACEKVREYSDIKYTTAGRTVIMFNDDYFGFTEATWDQRQKGEDMDDAARLVIDEFKSLLKQKKSIADNDQFVDMCGRDGFFKVFVSGYGLSETKGFEREMGPIEGKAGFRFKDFAWVATLNSDKGEIVVESEILPCNEKGESVLKKYSQQGGTIKGTYLNYLDNNAILTAVSSVNGSNYVESLVNSGVLDRLGDANMAQTFKDILASMDGDVAFQWNDLNASYMPSGSLYLSTKSDVGIKTIGDQLCAGGMAYEMEKDKYSISWNLLGGGSTVYDDPSQYDEFIPDDYSFDSVAVAEPDYMGEDYVEPQETTPVTGDPSLLFGWKQNATYVVLGENPTAFAKPKTPMSTKSFEGRRAYLRFNPAALLKCGAFDNMRESEEFIMVKKVLDLFDFAECYTEEDTPYRVTMRVEMKDKDSSPLKLLVDEWARILKQVM